jgi:hypothetical protein
LAEVIIERILPPVTQWATKKLDQSTQALVRKSTETKSKMAAVVGILDLDQSPRPLSSNRRKRNPDDSCSGGADHRKEPSSSRPQWAT